MIASPLVVCALPSHAHSNLDISYNAFSGTVPKISDLVKLQCVLAAAVPCAVESRACILKCDGVIPPQNAGLLWQHAVWYIPILHLVPDEAHVSAFSF